MTKCTPWDETLPKSMDFEYGPFYTTDELSV